MSVAWYKERVFESICSNDISIDVKPKLIIGGARAPGAPMVPRSILFQNERDHFDAA